MEDERVSEVLRKLHSLATISENDVLEAHIDADNVLCELLIELGYENIVKAYKEVHKWYS